MMQLQASFPLAVVCSSVSSPVLMSCISGLYCMHDACSRKCKRSTGSLQQCIVLGVMAAIAVLMCVAKCYTTPRLLSLCIVLCSVAVGNFCMCLAVASLILRCCTLMCNCLGLAVWLTWLCLSLSNTASRHCIHAAVVLRLGF